MLTTLFNQRIISGSSEGREGVAGAAAGGKNAVGSCVSRLGSGGGASYVARQHPPVNWLRRRTGDGMRPKTFDTVPRHG